MKAAVKLALIDNSIDAEVYAPCVHWAEFLPVPFDAFRAKEGRLPGLESGYTHVILSGSEASILERERWAEDEAEWVREARKMKGVRLLGSCWGHQLLAYALGGPDCVRRCREPEIGWIEIRVLAPSPLLGPPGMAWVFSSHFDEVVGLGPRFRILAESSVCAVQAFDMPGEPVWGLQIHPEISVARGRETLRSFAEGSLRGGGVFEDALRAEPRDSGLIRGIVAAFLGNDSTGAADGGGEPGK
jgi:GMP synthase-like glutamine amidotransferase